MQLADILDLQTHPINDLQYQHRCRQNLRRDGALIMSGLLRPQALAAIRAEGLQHQHLAYYTKDHVVDFIGWNPCAIYQLIDYDRSHVYRVKLAQSPFLSPGGGANCTDYICFSHLCDFLLLVVISILIQKNN